MNYNSLVDKVRRDEWTYENWSGTFVQVRTLELDYAGQPVAYKLRNLVSCGRIQICPSGRCPFSPGPDFGTSNRLSPTAANFLRWETFSELKSLE